MGEEGVLLIHFELLTDKSSSKQGDARDAPKSRKDARLEKTTIEDVETAQCSEGNKRSEQVGIEQLSTRTSNLRRSNQADQTGDGPPKFPTMRVLEIFDDIPRLPKTVYFTAVLTKTVY